MAKTKYHAFWGGGDQGWARVGGVWSFGLRLSYGWNVAAVGGFGSVSVPCGSLFLCLGIDGERWLLRPVRGVGGGGA